jgi:hypothetical protein
MTPDHDTHDTPPAIESERREPIPPSLAASGGGDTTPGPKPPSLGPRPGREDIVARRDIDPPPGARDGELAAPRDMRRIVSGRRDGVSAFAVVAVTLILVGTGGYFAWSHAHRTASIVARPATTAGAAPATTVPSAPSPAIVPSTPTPATAAQALPAPPPAIDAAAKARQLDEEKARLAAIRRREQARRAAKAAEARHEAKVALARRAAKVAAARREAKAALARREAKAAEARRKEQAEAARHKTVATKTAQPAKTAARHRLAKVAPRKAAPPKTQQVARAAPPHPVPKEDAALLPESAPGQAPPLDVTDLPPLGKNSAVQ